VCEAEVSPRSSRPSRSPRCGSVSGIMPPMQDD
jgi:hypothetical protein